MRRLLGVVPRVGREAVRKDIKVTHRQRKLTLPPTRNHRQLADWINVQKLVDEIGRPVVASTSRITTNTDTRVAGTHFRRQGRGRQGLLLEIWPIDADRWLPEQRLYRHESSETYRKHSEAREWVERNLRRAKAR